MDNKILIRTVSLEAGHKGPKITAADTRCVPAPVSWEQTEISVRSDDGENVVFCQDEANALLPWRRLIDFQPGDEVFADFGGQPNGERKTWVRLQISPTDQNERIADLAMRLSDPLPQEDPNGDTFLEIGDGPTAEDMAELDKECGGKATPAQIALFEKNFLGRRRRS